MAKANQINTLAIWLERISRYLICFLMLVYGTPKIFQGQFYTDHYWRDTTLGNLTGMELTWSFFSYSPIYESILGVIEVTVGLLVFFKRTTKLGVLLFLPVIINITIINILYNIHAMGSALPLLVAGIILFLINFNEYKTFFWDKSISNNTRTGPRVILLRVALISLGIFLASAVLYNNKYRLSQDQEIKGGWSDTTEANGQKIYFEKGRVCVIKDNNGQLHFAEYQTENNSKVTVLGDSGLLNWDHQPYQVIKDSLIVRLKNGSRVLIKTK